MHSGQLLEREMCGCRKISFKCVLVFNVITFEPPPFEAAVTFLILIF